MKTCLICKETKEPSEFSPNNQKKDRLHPYCKPCQSAKQSARIKARLAAGGVERQETGSRRCPKCETIKPVEAFGANRANPNGLQFYCRTCAVATVTASRHKDPTSHRESSKRWKQENPEQAHDMHLRRTYGVEYGTYQTKLSEQDGVCAICKTENPGGNSKNFHMDHCHDTGKVRGLLCTSCNNGIGRFRHDPELVKRAVDYLVAHSSTV